MEEMELIPLPGALLASRPEAMELLGQALHLPEWWGRNLDALYDCLTDLGRPVRLELYDRSAAESTPFGRRLLRVMEDAAAVVPWLELTEG